MLPESSILTSTSRSTSLLNESLIVFELSIVVFTSWLNESSISILVSLLVVLCELTFTVLLLSSLSTSTSFLTPPEVEVPKTDVKKLPAALIVNTRSRRGAELFDRALDTLKAESFNLTAVYPVRHPSELIATVDRALADGAELIILGSGDGTVSEVVVVALVF